MYHMEFVSVRVAPYDVLRVREYNGSSRVLVRFHTGQYVWLDWDEYKFLMRLSPVWTLQPLLDGDKKILDNLVKLGVAHVKEACPRFYITFKVSRGCNLGCAYCYEWANPEKLSMSARIDLAERTVKLFSEIGSLFFVWHGGEPTLFWETIIEPVVSKYYKKDRVRFGMQSNGVRFADENFADRVAKFAKQYDMGIGISIDGFKEDNWMRRFPDGTPAWEYTVEGIRNLVSRGVRTGSIVVVNDRSVHHLVDIVKWLHEDLGLHGGRLNPLYPAGHPEVVKHTPDPEEYAEGLVKVAKRVIEYNLDGDEVRDEFTVKNIVEYLTSFFNATSSICVRNVCGAGTYFFSIQPNGDVWPCDHVQFSIGNILDGWTPSVPRPAQLYKFWEAQVRQFQVYYNSESPCARCPYRTYCNGGGCTAFLIDMYGYEFYKKPPVYCPRKLFEFFEKLVSEQRDLELAALAPNHVYKYWYLGGVPA